MEVYATGGTDGMLRTYDGEGPLDSVVVGGTVTELDWHPAGRLLAVSLQGGGAGLIYDTVNEKKTVLDSLDETGARAIGWNPAGDRLAVGDYRGNLSIFDTSGTLLEQHQLRDKAIIGLDWSPDGSTIATVAENLILFDVESREQTVITDRKEDVLMLSVAYHPSGDVLVTGDYGDYDHDYPPLLQYWDAQGNPIRSISKKAGEYRSLEWSHDGSKLAAVSDALRLYDTEGNKTSEQSVADGALLWSLSWSTDDRAILLTDGLGNLHRITL
jgi:YD repeat-containing protein